MRLQGFAARKYGRPFKNTVDLIIVVVDNPFITFSKKKYKLKCENV